MKIWYTVENDVYNGDEFFNVELFKRESDAELYFDKMIANFYKEEYSAEWSKSKTPHSFRAHRVGSSSLNHFEISIHCKNVNSYT